MRGRRITQRDPATLAGISQAMVSIALNGGSPSVPRILWTGLMRPATELGYVPNRFAQALKTSRTMTIACIVPDITNPFYPSLIRGIQSVSRSEGYDVIAVNTDGVAERRAAFPRLVAAGACRWCRRRVLDAARHGFQTSLSRRAGRADRIHTQRDRSTSARQHLRRQQSRPYAMTRYLVGRGHGDQHDRRSRRAARHAGWKVMWLPSLKWAEPRRRARR